uniref:Uncharacterized protein n=1 Tax=Magallana gigas TaxID=29159 RepID=K1Q6Q4_MAGGI
MSPFVRIFFSNTIPHDIRRNRSISEADSETVLWIRKFVEKLDRLRKRFWLTRFGVLVRKLKCRYINQQAELS